MRKDYGDSPQPAYSIIKHLRKICPGVWVFKFPRCWHHESGVSVRIVFDHSLTNLMYITGTNTTLATRTWDGWKWNSEGERLLEKLTGNA